MSIVNRKIIKIDEERCDGCGQCVPACAEGAIQVIDGKAKLVADKFCDGLGACLGDCPNDALEVIEREADEFDEEAVEEYLESLKGPEKEAEQTLPCGCPSTQIQSFDGLKTACQGSPAEESTTPTALAHWPIQIRLIPPEAPFLKNADLLVLADCVSAAYPGLHQKLLPGKTVLMGCPKLDDAEFYIQRFKEIFQKAGPKSVTVAKMEVPCCSGMVQIVKEAMKAAGTSIPFDPVTISVRGEILHTLE